MTTVDALRLFKNKIKAKLDSREVIIPFLFEIKEDIDRVYIEMLEVLISPKQSESEPKQQDQ